MVRSFVRSLPAASVLFIVAAVHNQVSATTSRTAQPAPGERAPTHAGAAVAITDVTVITMRGNQRLEHQTVLTSGDTIVWVGAAPNAHVPASATVIDGRGKFVIPGLTDAHVHFFSWGPALPPELPAYLAAGVTTVHLMMGSPAELAWRSQLAKGEIVGPRLFLAGPILTMPGIGFPPSHIVTPVTYDEGAKVVREQVQAGYDFIKVYDGLPLEAYNGAIAEARSAGIPVRGHISKLVGLANALRARQTIEHVEKIVYEGWPSHMFDSAAVARIPLIADSIHAAGSIVSTTLVGHEFAARLRQGGFDTLMTRTEMSYVPTGMLSWWKSVNHGSQPRRPGVTYDPFADFQLALARGLHRAGVPLLAGTDAPNNLLIPGFSLLDELETLVREVGLSPHEALEAATVNPAIVARDTSRSGRVEVGKVADLVVPDADPMVDIKNLRRITAVVAHGHAYKPSEIQALIASSASIPPAQRR